MKTCRKTNLPPPKHQWRKRSASVWNGKCRDFNPQHVRPRYTERSQQSYRCTQIVLRRPIMKYSWGLLTFIHVWLRFSDGMTQKHNTGTKWDQKYGFGNAENIFLVYQSWNEYADMFFIISNQLNLRVHKQFSIGMSPDWITSHHSVSYRYRINKMNYTSKCWRLAGANQIALLNDFCVLWCKNCSIV